MELKNLARYKRIVIQCHNIPDADSVASGYALQCYLRSLKTEAELVYGGPAAIQKPSLLMMLEALNIEIEHISGLPADTELLITVDCQRGAGNVQHFDLPDTAEIVVIDHHRPEIPENHNTVIRPHLASCATLVWDLLQKEGFTMDDSVRNALYYGLFCDTNGLSELRHPLDRDLADITFDAGLIRKLKNSAITAEELPIIGKTLLNQETIKGIGLFRSEPCDPNLLGFVSDIAQQVVYIDCCIIYNLQQHGVKLSVRSSVREIMASEIAGFLCSGAGSGGGTFDKAGGFITFQGMKEAAGETDPETYLRNRILAYIDHFDLIYAGKNNIDFSSMRIYKKMAIPVGYAKSAEVFPNGTKITVRTLEGDVDAVAEEGIYLMIGVRGEVYPIKKERFQASYKTSDAPFAAELEYTPAILNRVTGERRELMPYAYTCVPNDEKYVRARPLAKPTKVFTSWDTDKYFSGAAGDWLVANEGSYDDCYIVQGDIFTDTYAEMH